MTTITGILKGFLYFLVVFVMGPFLFATLHKYFNPSTFLRFEALGIITFFSGILITVYSSFIFIFLGKGTPQPDFPPKKLVIMGLYKFTRNPIYLGHFLILFSLAVIVGSIFLYVYSVFYFLVIHFYVVRHEEPLLVKRFGAEYEDYMQAVKRWI